MEQKTFCIYTNLSLIVELLIKSKLKYFKLKQYDNRGAIFEKISLVEDLYDKKLR